jgi:hypothetical protein
MLTSLRTLALVCCAVAVAACDGDGVQDITGTRPESRIKFFNFGVNTPSVHFFAGDAKITATTSATGVESTAGIASGGVGSGGLYSLIDPGQYTFTGRITATVDKGLAISTVTGDIARGKAYSLYISGFYNTTTKQAEGFIVEDNFPETFDFSVAYVRFVNAISNANPMQLVITDATAGNSLPVGDAIAYKAGGAFIAVPPSQYNLATRYAGGTTNVITRTGVAFSGGRVYTITARGDITVTSTTAATRPQLDNTLNR